MTGVNAHSKGESKPVFNGKQRQIKKDRDPQHLALKLWTEPCWRNDGDWAAGLLWVKLCFALARGGQRGTLPARGHPKGFMKRTLRRLTSLTSLFGFDPRHLAGAIRGVPHFWRD